MIQNHNKDPSILEQLENIIHDRLSQENSDSYVHRLVASGMDRVLQKIGEEATEFVIAGKNNNRAEVCEEGADLLFHLLVFLNAKGMQLSDITAVLAQRAAHADSENES